MVGYGTMVIFPEHGGNIYHMGLLKYKVFEAIKSKLVSIISLESVYSKFPDMISFIKDILLDLEDISPKEIRIHRGIMVRSVHGDYINFNPEISQLKQEICKDPTFNSKIHQAYQINIPSIFYKNNTPFSPQYKYGSLSVDYADPDEYMQLQKHIISIISRLKMKFIVMLSLGPTYAHGTLTITLVDLENPIDAKDVITLKTEHVEDVLNALSSKIKSHLDKISDTSFVFKDDDDFVMEIKPSIDKYPLHKLKTIIQNLTKGISVLKVGIKEKSDCIFLHVEKK